MPQTSTPRLISDPPRIAPPYAVRHHGSMELPEHLAHTEKIWAKTYMDEGVLRGFPLYHHLNDVASMAETAVARWLGPEDSIPRSGLRSRLGMDPVKVVEFLAIFHDIGKASPWFQQHQPSLCKEITDLPFEVFANHQRHEMVSAQFLRRFLIRYGANRGAVRSLCTIVAGHHGFFPHRVTPSDAEDEGWERVRLDIVTELCAEYGIGDVEVAALAKLSWSPSDVSLVSSLLVICDWCASNQDAFPVPFEPGVLSQDERVARGVERLGFGPTWVPAIKWNASGGWTKRALDSLSASMSGPGIIVSETSRPAAYRDSVLNAAGRIAQATGVSHLTVSVDGHTVPWSVIRAIGSHVADAGQETAVGATHGWSRDMKKHLCQNEWFDGRLAPLAPISVTTLDQLLASALRVKYAFLRQAGLANSVIVVDGFCASDEQRLDYLCAVLENAGHWGASVVVSSGVLPNGARKRMLDAYSRGAGWKTDVPLAGQCSDRVTVLDKEGVRSESRSGFVSGSVALSWTGLGVENVVCEAKSLSGRYQKVGVVLDSASRVQEAYDGLVSSMPEGTRTLLLHESFSVIDKRRVEAEVEQAMEDKRPAIIVATDEVVRLESRFDALVTDIAPGDVLMRRISLVDNIRPAVSISGMEHSRPVPGMRAKPQGETRRPEVEEEILDRYDPIEVYAAAARLSSMSAFDVGLQGWEMANWIVSSEIFPDAWGSMADIAERSIERRNDALRKAEMYLPPSSRSISLDGFETVPGSESESMPGARPFADTIEVCLFEERGSGESKITVPLSYGRRSSSLVKATGARVVENAIPVPAYVLEGGGYDQLVRSSTDAPSWSRRRALKFLAPVVLSSTGDAEVGGYTLHYNRRTGLWVSEKDSP